MENHFEICMTEDQLRGISSIGLAHMGDAVFELLVRGWLCQHGKGHRQGTPSGHHPVGTGRASGRLRGKDPPPADGGGAGGVPPGPQRAGHSIPSHASRAQYSTATALEALFGWLYLGGQCQRASALFDVMMEE